jgi:rod shape determining protein RodA
MIIIVLIYLFVLFLLALMFNNIIIITVIFSLTVIASIFCRKKIRNILLFILIGAASVGFVLSVDYFYDNVLKDHQRKRIDVWTYSIRGVDIDKKDAGYNFYQSKVAIGSGGFSGKGFLEGTQTKMNFIPEQDTDFIFCTVGEEWGFLGSFFVVSLYGLLLIRIVKKAEKQRSDFSRIYGYAVASILLFHFLVNVGMTIGLVPVIGIPLPFISYGGSSLWSFTILLFIFIKQDSYRSEVI